ncbi:MAG: protein kinase, partial [Ignavibacteriae bacterium]|nr:protein kinase [Ignavibacteriota bacterium]
MIGKKISQYLILEKLGGGGMGVVYKAEDTKLKRTVALKFLSDDLISEKEARERFLLEAQAASKLDHPNICTVYEINDAGDGHMFIAMSFCEGESLRERIRTGPLPLQEAVGIALQIAQGLACAHNTGVVHRDVKPANIMMTPQGIVKIVDFGLAKLIGMSRLTQVGATAGTIAYMSPEQCRGESLDQRTDVWAVGVVLYEMLAGQHPFKGDYDQVIIYSILNSEVVSITEQKEDIPPEVEQIIRKCLQKDPAKRYANATELAEDLDRVLRGEKPKGSRPQLTARFPVHSIPRGAQGVVKLVAGVIIAVALLLLIPTIRDPLQDCLKVTIIPEEKHLVVLPLTNVGDDPANQAFCDGLVETLTSKLTQLQLAHGSLWVVAASEVRERSISSVSQARKIFGVTLGLTGSVQRNRDRIRLTLNLVDAKTSRQLRSTVSDETGSTLSVLQDKTIRNIAEMLQVELDPGALHALTAGNTDIGKAYDFYLQGRGYLQRYERMENLSIAISLFERALREDQE